MIISEAVTFQAKDAIRENRCVKFVVDGGKLKVEECDTQGEFSIGTAMFEVEDGDFVTVNCTLEILCVSYTTFSLGAQLTTQTDGRVETAASGDSVFGIAKRAATAANQTIEVFRLFAAMVV